MEYYDYSVIFFIIFLRTIYLIMTLTKIISGWGGYPKTKSEIIIPKNLADFSNSLNQPFIPRGMGRSYGDSANFNRVIQTNYLNNLIEFDQNKGLLTVESGMTINSVLKLIVPRGWFISVSPGTSYATIGGAIASDVHGKNHHKVGTFGEHVLSIRMMLGNKDIVNITPINMSDLFHATCGGMGLTGIILSATIKLLPIKSSKIIQTELKSKSLEETCSIFEENEKINYSVAWLDCMARNKSQGKSIVILGEHQKDENLNFNIKKNFNIPLNMPSFFMNKYFISTFNKIFYATKKNNKKEVDLINYFYPLDKINNWNKIYGKKGFIQYQFVIPNEDVVKNIRIILNKIYDTGLCPFLCVLKKFRKQNNNLLSFPIEGYTLALDFKLTSNLFKSISKLDELVIAMGGRIYLTKDSLMSENTFKSTYKRWEEFENIREKYGAINNFCSDQSKRLGLK